MPRVARHSLVPTHELVAELGSSFLGGPNARDPFDTARLRAACNLMARLCSQLHLAGDYAITPLRGATPMVGVAFASEPDYDSVARLVLGETPGTGPNSFVLDAAAHAGLLEVAGPPDHDRAGRRSKEKEAAMAAAFGERWS